MTTNAEPKNGEVNVLFRKSTNGYSAMIRFIDQFGIERALAVDETRCASIWKIVHSTLDGRSVITVPSSHEPGVENVYEKKESK
jgi:hypothetical protein